MPSADYVIVGAGSAGCVLAARLTEDPDVRVLLIEAGRRDRHPNIKIPAAFANQFHTKLDWDFATDPEPHCDGRSLYIPRGRSLGGSSSMNAMLYVRGRPMDYDGWAARGAEGWSYREALPYFLKSEHNERGASEYHGESGPLNVADQRSPRLVNREILAACEANGIPLIDDYNGPEQDGASMFQVTQKGGRRWSTADAFLRPAMERDNLEVVTGALVGGVELDGGRATGVRYRTRRGEQVAEAAREVILSAGAIGSPQLLQLSGIGPADVLGAAGVPVRHELAGVGRELQDHPFVTMLFEATGIDSLWQADGPKSMAEWMLRRSGKLTSPVAEAVAFVRTRGGLPAADIQFHMGAAYYDKHGEEEFDGHAITLAPVLVSPKARGTVTLRSADPADKPRILTNSLGDAEDVASLVAGMRLARAIAASEPLASRIVRELKPGPGVGDDDEDLAASLRERVELIYHPVGTCRMGTDDGAVVDPSLRVRGLDGLRVVDASVMPIIPGGNTNAPTIMVAERAADLIRGRAPVPVG
ncbi:MAG TPA: GMC family oxidoreductase N-terminal domain-containing protein [Solirubrobacteraceae bacterium]|nr:GMC family oxidoreductase N-terminal domain-containing protein [Solirubrobacteraceae bacterium]